VAISDRTLTPLQRDVLHVLAEEPRAYLSGGAALSAYYLHHRQSHDLDLFTPDADVVEHLARRLRSSATARAWSIEELQTAPGFKRFSVTRRHERTIVDLVHEPVPQEVPLMEKPVEDGVRHDALADLVANKLGALLGRGDAKDLVDLYFLSLDGHDILAALPAAHRKDGGMDPTVLAWVARGTSSEVDDLLLIRSVSASDLAEFRDELATKLLDAAWPPDAEDEPSA
jgi:hypothetical protein